MLRLLPGTLTSPRRGIFLAALPQRDRLACGALLLGAALWVLAPFPLAGGGAALFFLGAILRLDLALIAVVLACPFYLPVAANPLPPKPIGPYRFSLLEVATLLCGAAWLVRALIDRPATIDRLRQAGWALVPPLLFLLAATLSTLAAVNRHEALRELRTVAIEPVLFGLLVLSTLDRRGVARLVVAGVALGATVAAYSFYHYVVVRVVEEADGVRRVLAVYHSPNQLALLFDRLLPLTVALALPAPAEPWRRWLRRGMPAGVAAVIMAGALVLTYSRGAYLAVAVATLAILAWRGWRFLLPAVVLGMLGSGLLLTQLSPARLVSEQTSVGRLTLWSAAWRMVLDHPLLGVGPDNFLYAYRDRGYLPPEGWREPDTSHPHNLLLDAWLRTGILGFGALAAAAALFWRAAVRLLRSRSDPSWPTALALAGGMLAALTHGLFDNGYFLPDLAVLFWLAVAGMAVLARPSAPAAHPAPPPASPLAASAPPPVPR
ncbi:MAG: O-antigen ligase family protein [Chloroflexi bacterium]|nr:O-antigen ligase family protein [Chloroflexota bacterium]